MARPAAHLEMHLHLVKVSNCRKCNTTSFYKGGVPASRAGVPGLARLGPNSELTDCGGRKARGVRIEAKTFLARIQTRVRRPLVVV